MKQITAQAVAQLQKEGKSLSIIDVREVEEVRTGKIAGSMNIPLPLLEARMPELDKKKEYIIVCHSGGRSSMAVNFLESYGFDVTNLTGGMLAWEQQNR